MAAPAMYSRHRQRFSRKGTQLTLISASDFEHAKLGERKAGFLQQPLKGYLPAHDHGVCPAPLKLLGHLLALSRKLRQGLAEV